jgi:hypothetical protein
MRLGLWPSLGIKCLAATDFAAAAYLNEWAEANRENHHVKHKRDRVAASGNGAGVNGSVRIERKG